jgi:hypothetical protein
MTDPPKAYGFVLQDRSTGEFKSPVLWTRQAQREALSHRPDAISLRLERVRVVACTRRPAHGEQQ